MALFSFLVLMTLQSPVLSSEHETDLPAFFDDSINIWVFFGGIAFIGVNVGIAFLVCKVGKRKG